MDLDAFTDMCLPYLIADGRVAENPDEKDNRMGEEDR